MTDSSTMLSRVADSLYWMSRYLERAEHTSRLIDVHLNLTVEVASSTEHQRAALLASLGLSEQYDAEDDDDTILEQITFDDTNDASIVATIASARENARQVREQLSSEMWTQLNTLYLHVHGANARKSWEDAPHEFLMEVRSGSHLFQGVTDATMNHDQGWHFIQLGRYIERALSLVTLLDVHLRETIWEQAQITPERYFERVRTLKSVSAYEAYCKVYSPNLKPAQIVEFLLYNRQFPRSLRFCIDQAFVSLHALADATGGNKGGRLYRVVGRLQSTLSFDELHDIGDFHQYLMDIMQQVNWIHDTLYKTFVTYSIESAL